MTTPRLTIGVVSFVLLSSLCAMHADVSAWKVAVELDDGSRIVGEPRFQSVTLQTSKSKRSVPLPSLVYAELKEDTWIVHTDDDQAPELTGKLLTPSLRIKTLFGEVDVPTRHAVSVAAYSTKLNLTLPARKDLVLYLNFDRHSGKRTRNVASFGHHAAVLGAKWIPDGRRGGAYEFDEKATLEVPHDPELCPEKFTLAAWVYPNDAEGNWRLLISKTNASSWYGGYGFCRYPGDNRNLYFYMGDYSSGAVSERIPHGQWVHLAGVFDGKQVRLYVNGEPSPAVDVAAGGAPQHTTTPFLIGGGGSYNWQGKIDEVMLFRRALSIEEIERLMIAGSPE